MLTIVPTPIGNLRDITLRALDGLREADLIACEDTRHTRKLLDAYEIKTPVVSYHEHSGSGRTREILEALASGKTVALVSDGGMPLISDPGFKLVQAARRQGTEITVLPGAVAAVTALTASGLATDAFSFHGFAPPKSAARRRLFESLAAREETLIFYESPFRLVKTLRDAQAVFGGREAAVCRELTKKFEEILRGIPADLAACFEKTPPKGEIVLLIAGKGRKKVF